MEETNIQAKRHFSQMGLALFALAAITSALQFFLSFLWTVSLQGTPLGDAEWMTWLITFAPMYFIGVPIGLWMMRKIPAESQPPVKLGAKRFWVLMLMCMPLMYGGNILGNMLSMMLSGGTAENALLDYIMDSPLYSMIVAVLIAPFIEEYIFRKQIIDRLGKYGEKTAILFSALTFGLFHMNLFQFFYAFGLGLIFAYTYTRTRKLRYPVFMHMIINFMGSVIAPLLLNMLDMDILAAMEAGEATMDQLLSILPGLLAYMGYFFALLLSVIAGFVLLMIHWKKRQLLPASQELPQGVAGKIAYRNWGMALFTGFCLVMILFSLISGLL